MRGYPKVIKIIPSKPASRSTEPDWLIGARLSTQSDDPTERMEACIVIDLWTAHTAAKHEGD
jgi:hypothetical protein